MTTVPDKLIAQDVERSLLSAIVTHPEYAGVAYEILDPGAFWYKRHRHVWRAIVQCVESGRDPDPVAVIAELQKLGADVESSFVRGLSKDVANRSGVESDAEELADLYRRRQLWSTCRQTSRDLASREADYEGARQQITDHWQDGAHQTTGRQIAEVADEVLHPPDDEAEEEYKTGVGVVDELMDGGLATSRFTVVAGRPGHGKTSLVVKTVLGLVANHGFSVDIWYTDGNEKDIAVAFLSAMTQTDNRRIRFDRVKDYERRELEAAKNQLAEWDMEVHRASRPTTSEILTRGRSRAAGADRYLCVVDYLQNVDAGHSGPSKDRKNVQEAARMMDQLATDTDSIALGLAQFNRRAENVEIPNLHHLKGSGKLEEAANNVLIWHRPYWEDDDAGDAGERFGVLKLAKSKHQSSGGNARIEVDAKLGINQFDEWDERAFATEQSHEPAAE